MLRIDHFEIRNLMVFGFFEHLKVIESLAKRTSSTLQFHSIIISVVEDLPVVPLAEEVAVVVVVVTFMAAVEAVINVVVAISEAVEEDQIVVVVITKILVVAVAIYVMHNVITFIILMPILVAKNHGAKISHHMAIKMTAAVVDIASNMIDL